MNELRYFSGLYPFELLSKNPDDYPDAREVYKIGRNKAKKCNYSNWVFKALLNKRPFWKIDDIVLLHATLMFKSIGTRFESKTISSTTRAILSYVKQIQEGKRYGN